MKAVQSHHELLGASCSHVESYLTIDLVTATLLLSNLTFKFAYCLLGCEMYILAKLFISYKLPELSDFI